MVPSKVGGGEDKTFHNRTVASREAEMTAFGEGNATARTYSMVRYSSS